MFVGSVINSSEGDHVGLVGVVCSVVHGISTNSNPKGELRTGSGMEVERKVDISGERRSSPTFKGLSFEGTSALEGILGQGDVQASGNGGVESAGFGAVLSWFWRV